MAQRQLRRRAAPVFGAPKVTLKGPQGSARFSVKLDGLFPEETAGAVEDTGPKWVQVTLEGNYQGYLGGKRPFQITRADLDQMVANIKNHPGYELDAAGKPIGHVIPWDYNHASEQPATEGSLPYEGAPAQAWTLDLEVRNGADGKAQLWALTEFLEPARTYVKAGQYRWASVAVVFNAVDPVSGNNVGSMVTSIALTNTPFVEGMEPLVASKQGNGAVVQAYRRTFYEQAQSPADAINLMKEMFGLPETAGVPELMMEFNKVQSWFAEGAAPLGTDPEYIIGSLRTILGLPALEPAVNVITYALTSVQALITDQALGAPAISTANDSLPQAGIVPPVTAAQRRKDEDMDLLKMMAEQLGVRESDTAVAGAVKDLVALRSGLCALFGTNLDGGSLLLERAKKAQSVEAKLKAILGALGVEDPDAALTNVKDLIAKADALKTALPELEGLKTKVKEQDAKSEEADVDAAIAASKLPATLKPALLLQRRQAPEEFAKQFPKTTAPAQPVIAARTALLQPNVHQTQQVQLSQSATINLANYAGANPIARAKAYLAQTHQGWDKLNNEQQWEHAKALRSRPDVIDQPLS